jgi:hypothetical protein
MKLWIMARKRTGRRNEQRHNVVRSLTTDSIVRRRKKECIWWFAFYSYCINKAMLTCSFVSFSLSHTLHRRVKYSKFAPSLIKCVTRERERNEKREEHNDCSTSRCLCKQLAKGVAPHFDVSLIYFRAWTFFSSPPLVVMSCIKRKRRVTYLTEKKNRHYH